MEVNEGKGTSVEGKQGIQVQGKYLPLKQTPQKWKNVLPDTIQESSPEMKGKVDRIGHIYQENDTKGLRYMLQSFLNMGVKDLSL